MKNSGANYLPLILVFLIFSMLLNCMGIIILQFSEQKISYQGLGVLEAFKDLPIAISSLLFLNLINRFGSKISLYTALGMVTVCCISVPFLSEFWFMKIWFALIGIGFAVAKISTFSLIKSNSSNMELAAVMNKVEAAFMFGIFFVNIGFGWLISSEFSQYWKFGFWLIAAIAMLNLFLLYKTDYREIAQNEKVNVIKGFIGLFNQKTFVFLFIMLLVVFTEQCLNSWLPSFYRSNFEVSSGFALQSSAFLALFSFIGRTVTSSIISKFSWYKYVFACLIILFAILLLMFVSINYFKSYSYFLVYLIPGIGLFLAPLYPVYNSRMLQNYDEKKVNMLISALVIFSSVGSSLGSIYISSAFHLEKVSFYPAFIMLPVLFLMILTIIFKFIISK